MSVVLERKADRFGRLFPPRMLAHALTYLDPANISKSQRVCKGWKLPANLLDEVWRCCFERDWEPKLSESEAFAVSGKDTPWNVRYHRATQTEANWRSGTYRKRSFKV